VDGADLGVRLRREERVEVVGRLAFLDLPDGGPVSPDAGKAGEGAGLIEREPDVAAFDLVEFAETVERNYAAERERILNDERPYCPECGMRMISTSPTSKKFECLRCGYAGPAIKRDAAE
jgi:ribosomal protein S27AE